MTNIFKRIILSKFPTLHLINLPKNEFHHTYFSKILSESKKTFCGILRHFCENILLIKLPQTQKWIWLLTVIYYYKELCLRLWPAFWSISQHFCKFFLFLFFNWLFAKANQIFKGHFQEMSWHTYKYDQIRNNTIS